MATLTQVSVIDTLGLTDNLGHNVVLRESASDTLVLSQSVSTNYKLERITSALSLVDAVSRNIINLDGATDFIILTDFVEVSRPRSVSVATALTLTQVIGVNLHGRVASSAISLTQNVSASIPKEYSADSYLSGTGDITGVDVGDPEALEAAVNAAGLNQSLSVTKVLNLSLQSYISLADQAARAYALAVETVIPLSQEARTVEWELVDTGIVLYQTVSVDVCEPTTSELTLTQLAEANGVRDRDLTSAISLDSTVSAFIVNLNNYGLIADQASVLQVVAPTLTPASHTILSYPAVDPTFTVSLPNPEWDNYIQLEQRRINRRTRGGTLVVARDDNWPSARRLKLDFKGLSERQRTDMLLFLKTTLGKQIRLKDHESREWIGLIITPTTMIKTIQERPTFADYELTVEFEGSVLVGG